MARTKGKRRLRIWWRDFGVPRIMTHRGEGLEEEMNGGRRRMQGGYWWKDGRRLSCCVCQCSFPLLHGGKHGSVIVLSGILWAILDLISVLCNKNFTDVYTVSSSLGKSHQL